MDILQHIDGEAYEAVLWLRENQGLFSRIVYEPILTQIKMKNMKDATYLESNIDFNDMKAFVCQNRNDLVLFMNISRELNLNINIVCPPTDALDEYRPDYPIHRIKSYGFTSYVTDLYDAPLTIHQYLCENYNLHNIPVGGDMVDQTQKQFISSGLGINKFCSREYAYSVQRSKYSGLSSMSVVALKESKCGVGVFT